MPQCSWCYREALFRDSHLHFACRLHREQLLAGLKDVAMSYDRLAAEHGRNQRQKDKFDLAR